MMIILIWLIKIKNPYRDSSPVILFSYLTYTMLNLRKKISNFLCETYVCNAADFSFNILFFIIHSMSLVANSKACKRTKRRWKIVLFPSIHDGLHSYNLSNETSFFVICKIIDIPRRRTNERSRRAILAEQGRKKKAVQDRQ